jgi:hypothetical protein
LPDKLVLATTKSAAHRIYLGKDIYADLSLLYGHGSYRPFLWTYPDYASGESITMFNLLRDRHRLEKSMEKGIG